MNQFQVQKGSSLLQGQASNLRERYLILGFVNKIISFSWSRYGGHYTREDGIPHNMIRKWLEDQKEEGQIGEFLLCYSVNPDLQDLFEDNKIETDATLSDGAQNSYIFEHADDAHKFSNFWRKIMGVVDINFMATDGKDHPSNGIDYNTIIQNFNTDVANKNTDHCDSF